MWAQVINTAIAIWIIAAPAALAYAGPQATSDRIVAPIMAAFAWIATAQCTRAVRWWLIPPAAWLFASPFILDAPAAPTINHTLCAVAIAALATVRGKVDKPFAGGWRVLARRNPFNVLNTHAANTSHTKEQPAR